MRNISFPLGATEVNLTSPAKLTTAELENLILQLTEIIQSLSEELNYNYTNAEVTRFNDADLGFPVSISQRLRDFLYLNLRYYDHSLSKFNPFYTSTGLEWPQSTADLIELRLDDKIAVRNADIKLTSALLHPHLLDQVDSLLRNSLGITDYLLSTPTMTIGRGKPEWEINYEVDANYSHVPIKVINQAAILEISDTNTWFANQEVSPKIFNPFSSTNSAINSHPAVVAAADTLTHAKVVAKQAINLRYPAELQALANQWRTAISVFHTDGSLQHFLPLKQ